MAAIITEQFRKVNANTLLDDLRSTTYYVGLGQQDAWPEDPESLSAPFPQGTYGDEHRALEHLTGLFKVNDFNTSIMIPKIEFQGGVEYKVYNPFDPTCFYTDIDNEVQPCYAMVDPNNILLCIGKNINATTMNISDIETALTINGLDDFGTPVLINGYIWVYIGRYTLYSDLNTNDFVAISAEPASSSSTENSYATGILEPIGNNNDILVTSLVTGDAGNSIQVELVEGSQSYTETVDVGITTITIGYAVGSTSQIVVNYVNSTSNTIQMSNSGTGEGIVSAYGPVLLSGGGSSYTVIKEATGGLVYGFSVINGGKDYFRTDDAGGGLKTTVNVPAILSGVDEFNNLKTEDILVAVTYDSDEKTIVNVNYNNDQIPSLKGFKHAKFDFTNWVSGNGFSDITSEAKILCNIAPIDGFGRNKTETLPAWYVGVYTNTSAATYIATNTGYHQVSLIRDPKKPDGNSVTGQYVQPLPYFTLGETGDGHVPNPALRPGWKIFQSETEAIGLLSHIQEFTDNTLNAPLDPIRYYYYPDPFVGYSPLLNEELKYITFESPDGVDRIDTLLEPIDIVTSSGYLHNSGKVVFQDNRGTIIRSEGQNEELKLVIQL